MPVIAYRRLKDCLMPSEGMKWKSGRNHILNKRHRDRHICKALRDFGIPLVPHHVQNAMREIIQKATTLTRQGRLAAAEDTYEFLLVS